MIKKKLLAAATSTAMLSSLMLAGSALAVDRVEVKVTSEPIQSGALCDKAGGFTLEFDSGTTITGGDQITVDVDFVNPTNFTELCRTFDIMIAPAGDGTTDFTAADAINSTGWATFDQDVLPGVGLDCLVDGHCVVIPAVDSPVTQIAVGAPATTDGGVIFHVTGAANTQRITIDVIGADGDDDGDAVTVGSITVGDDADDIVAVALLNQAINADYIAAGGQVGVWTDDTDPADAIWEAAADVEDNTLCINVNEWGAATVNANMDSAADKYTFIPSNPQIAHIVAAQGFEVAPCDKANCGDLLLGSDLQGQETCDPFDNEVDGVGAYCDTGNVHEDNELNIASAAGTFFEATDYNITMTILVNGVAGDNGVYFQNDPVFTGGYTSQTDVCAAATNVAAGATTFRNSAGSTIVPADPDLDDCAVVDANRAVSLTTAADDLGLDGTTHDFLNIDIPAMHYDLAELELGDAISVEVTLTRAPCGEVITTTHCLGTFVDACSVVASGNTITYPYFTDADDTDGFWDGIAVTNMSGVAGDVTFTLYEADGDVATFTTNVGANSMFVNLLSLMVSGGDFSLTTSVDGTLGNARGYIVATGDGIVIDGFGMIANMSTGESMGYLPRN